MQNHFPEYGRLHSRAASLVRLRGEWFYQCCVSSRQPGRKRLRCARLIRVLYVLSVLAINFLGLDVYLPEIHAVADGVAVDVAESGVEVVAALCRCGQFDGAVSLEAVRHALRPEVRQVGHCVGVVEQPDEAVGGVAHDEPCVVVPAEVQRASLEGEGAAFHGAERSLGEHHL